MNPMFYFLTLTAVVAATANAGGPVLDSKGHLIFRGSYYVIPRIFGAAGGGLALVPRGDKQCPLYVGHETSEVHMGIPVRFSSWMSRVGFVPESEDLNIMMDVKATPCSQLNYWWVAPSVKDRKTWFIAAGPKPKTDEDYSKTSFQIKKTGDSLRGYKIMFCPKGKYCMNVGISREKNGVRRLVLSSKPFPVVFVKAT
ncbi:kunitz trypsin inhibitor 1 [Raphanus sativus]|nr:kunitz trypsin inhibitor 1 [Raphanus sativus]